MILSTDNRRRQLVDLVQIAQISPFQSNPNLGIDTMVSSQLFVTDYGAPRTRSHCQTWPWRSNHSPSPPQMSFSRATCNPCWPSSWAEITGNSHLVMDASVLIKFCYVKVKTEVTLLVSRVFATVGDFWPRQNRTSLSRSTNLQVIWPCNSMLSVCFTNIINKALFRRPQSEWTGLPLVRWRTSRYFCHSLAEQKMIW